MVVWSLHDSCGGGHPHVKAGVVVGGGGAQVLRVSRSISHCICIHLLVRRHPSRRPSISTQMVFQEFLSGLVPFLCPPPPAEKTPTMHTFAPPCTSSRRWSALGWQTAAGKVMGGSVRSCSVGPQRGGPNRACGPWGLSGG